MATLPFKDDFEGYTAGNAPGGAWVEEDSGTSWTVQTAPTGLTGQALRRAQATSDDWLRVSWTRRTTGLLTVSATCKSPNTFTTSSHRGGIFLLYDNTTLVSGVQVQGNGLLLWNGSTPTIQFSLASNTVYVWSLTVNLDTGKIPQFVVNDTVYNNSGAGWDWYTGGGTPGGIDRIRISNYSPTATAGDYIWVDDVLFELPARSSRQTVSRQAVTRSATR